MCQKGLDSELIKEALNECYAGEDSLQAIKALLRKKGYHPGNADLKENQKIIGYLVRKGFQYEDIRKVVNLTNVL